MKEIMIKTKFWNDLTAPSSQKTNEGFSNTQGWEALVGQKGFSDTDLHPSGWVKVNDQRIFVVSEGEFISKGVEVKILSVDGNRVVVRESKSNQGD